MDVGTTPLRLEDISRVVYDAEQVDIDDKALAVRIEAGRVLAEATDTGAPTIDRPAAITKGRYQRITGTE